ncbi:hypothetical protein C0Q70_07632 [Pomacea canaliculata]|uniref:E3 SUMO-protein ligase NSE2 n=1 Tax=Pomacea canaliculata TaxID=400727 RepID=A0A2T7PFK4_POMCA|nr:E3 SUMO-protein ligase NSE2-like isoform X2 [Pomacea canaliculata]PVD32203.1 hypothetical protein C0Q70_07632 [Pomacea canaliculata]
MASSSVPANFRGVEQSLNIMRQVKSYFSVGMENVLEVATDMADYSKAEDSQVQRVREIMLSYVKMERDLENFMTAVSRVMEEGGRGASDLEALLDEKLEQLSQKNDDRVLSQHEKVLEFEQKILDSQNPGNVPTAVGSSASMQEDDIEMTQAMVNTKCPYTGQEMVDPVRNKICKHTYDKVGILEYIKRRGRKARCPVSGCSNSQAITSADLEENREMRRHIQNLKR